MENQSYRVREAQRTTPASKNRPPLLRKEGSLKDRRFASSHPRDRNPVGSFAALDSSKNLAAFEIYFQNKIRFIG